MNTNENGANQEDELPNNDQKSKRKRKRKNERTNNKNERKRIAECPSHRSNCPPNVLRWKRTNEKSSERTCETKWTAERLRVDSSFVCV